LIHDGHEQTVGTLKFKFAGMSVPTKIPPL
jgi:hypothetical protein